MPGLYIRMSSNLSGLSAEQWLATIQDYVTERTVRSSVGTNQIVDTKVQHQPYVDNAVADTTSDGTYTAGSNDATDEPFTISSQVLSTEKIKASDAMASNYGLNMITAKNHGNALARREDQMMFAALSSNLGNTVDDGDLATATNGGGTNAIVLSSSNAEEVVDLGLQLAFEDDMPSDAMVDAVFDFNTAAKFKQFLTGTGNNVADERLRGGFGYFGTAMNGLRIYTSNLIEQEVVLSMATQPTADDTIVVNGVTFTFKAAPSAAGEVDLGADVDATRANLALAINGTGTPGATTYIEISTANRKSFKRRFISATNDDTANTLTIKCYGPLTVSETLTDGTDAFGDVFKNLPIFQHGIPHNYRLSAPGTDLLSTMYTMRDGVAYANKTITGFSGVEQEVTEIFGSHIWNNSKNFGSTLKIKA